MAETGKIVCDERLKHIAVIMDGNGRWAKKRGMPRSFGHRAGAAAFRKIVDYCEIADYSEKTKLYNTICDAIVL